MNFVARALKSLTDSAPFHVGDRVDVGDGNPWDLYEGTLKASGRKVSLFHYKTTDAAHPWPFPPPARNLVRLAASLPAAVELVDVYPPLDSGDAQQRRYVVTERVYPIDFSKNPEFTKFALKCALDGLAAAARDRVHVLGIGPHTLMQAESGAAKLVGLDFVYAEADATTRAAADELRYFYPATLPKDTRVATYDTYAFALLARDVLPALAPSCARFVTSTRPRVTELRVLDAALSDNALSRLIAALQAAPVTDGKPTQASAAAVAECVAAAAAAHCLDPRVVRGLVLPPLYSMAALLPVALDLVAGLDELAAGDAATEWLCTQWASLDRAARMCLLAALPRIAPKLPLPLFQQRIAPKLLLGFGDSNPQVKLASLAAVPHVLDLLSSKQLNADLLRALARTLADADAGVRQQTIQTLYALCPRLAVKHVVYTALARALKDPAAANREEALLCIAALDVPVADVVERLFGPVAACVMDSSAAVAARAWALTDALLAQMKAAACVTQPEKGLTREEAATRLARDAQESAAEQAEHAAAAGPQSTAHATLEAAGGAVAASANDSLTNDDALVADLDAWGWDDGGDVVVDDQGVADAWGFD